MDKKLALYGGAHISADSLKYSVISKRNFSSILFVLASEYAAIDQYDLKNTKLQGSNSSGYDIIEVLNTLSVLTCLMQR